MTDTTTQPTLVELADTAYEAVRAINHRTLGAVIPPQLVYDLVGNLKTAGGYGLDQALRQLAGCVEQGQKRGEIRADGDGDPAQLAAEVIAELRTAAAAAFQLGQALDRAQSALSTLSGPE